MKDHIPAAPPKYVVRSEVIVRAPLLPVGLYLDSFSAGTTRDGALAEALANPVFREALWYASPSLAGLAERYFGEPSRLLPAKRARSLNDSLTGYLIRGTTRATPFGLFSGTGIIAWGDGLDVEIKGADHRRVARLDLDEVMGMVRNIEHDPESRRCLQVYANPAALLGGERIRLHRHSSYGCGDAGGELSVRSTPALAAVLRSARRPVRFSDLVEELTCSPHWASSSSVEADLLSLMRMGFLLTTLRPPLGVPDPLAYLFAETGRNGVAPPPDARELRRAIETYNLTRPGEGVDELRACLRALDPSGPSLRQRKLTIDTLIGVSGHLPEDLGSEAGAALDVLFRLSTTSPWSPALAAFADEFSERYGEREVPVLEALDPTAGVGPLAEPPASAPGQRLDRPEIDEFLHDLVFDVLRSGARETVLGGEQLARLQPPPGVEPPSVDLLLELALDSERDWIASVKPSAVVPGGRIASRLWHLDDRFGSHLRVRAAAEADESEKVLFVGLSDPHYTRGFTNLAVAPVVYAYESAIATTPSVGFDRHVPLSDLVVGVAAGRVYLRSRNLGKRVVLRVPHVISPVQASPVVRFLRAVSEEGYWRPVWNWGALSAAPYLPRLRVGRVVIAPARWRLTGSGRGRDENVHDLDRWRSDLSVPRFVRVGSRDQRLLLDLDCASHQEILRREVRRGASTVEEAIQHPENAAARDRAGNRFMLEAAITLDAEVVAAVESVEVRPTVECAAGERRRLPGEGWWFFKLYGHPGHRNQVLQAIRDGVPDGLWFFVRYQDPQPHLRVRVRTRGAADPLEVVRPLVKRGLLTHFEICTYERELERYGGPEGMALCEEVFSADTVAVLDLIGDTSRHREIDGKCLAMLSIDGLLRGLGFGRSDRLTVYTAGCQRLEGGLPERKHRPRFSIARELARALLGDQPPETAGAATVEWGFALGRFGHRLRTLERNGDIGVGLTTLARSLTHMHANRLGLDAEEEYEVLRCLRDVTRGLLYTAPGSTSRTPAGDGHPVPDTSDR